MKKYILVLFLLCGFYGFSQNVDLKKLPSAVNNRFSSLYPNVTDNEWGKVNLDNYETEFVYKEELYSVLFDTKGLVLETFQQIKLTDLPAPVNEYITNNYAWKKILLASKVTDGRGKLTYRVTLGIDDIKLIFDYQGTFVRLSK